MRTRTVTAAMAFGGGAFTALSLPPWGWWPLAVAGLALAARATARAHAASDWWSRLVVGTAFGLSFFLPGLWWATEFHAVGYVLLTLLETSFFAVALALVRGPVGFTGAIVLAEAARSAVPFGGLPLTGIALGQVGGPLLDAARIGGALLIVGVVAAIGAAVGWRTWSAVAAGAVSVVLAGATWVAPAGRDVAGQPLDVALVQGGGPRGFRATESNAEDVLRAHLGASRRLEPPLDLVLWPENAVDVDALRDSDAADALADIARRVGATVVAGVTEDNGEHFENVAVAWSPQGRIVDTYTKVRRVPFGEYVPGRRVFERLADLSVIPRDAVSGRGPAVVHTHAGTFAIAVSYEVFFAERPRSGVRAGGTVLLVPTNAASFTTSQVPTQEVAAARLRAVETARPVLQAAPTGYSAVIDWRGRVLDRSTLGRPELVRGRVHPRAGETLYVRAGDAPVLVLAAAMLLVSTVRVRVSRR